MAAEAAVGFAIETFGNLLIDEAKFLVGVSDQVEDLKLELARLQSFLRDAQERKNEKRDIQVWISQSRDLAYEAEDLIEAYAFRVASQRESIHKRTLRFLKECFIRRSIGSDIQKLKSKISSLTRSFQEYGISSSVTEREASSSSSQQQLRRTYSHVVEDDFIELDNDVEMLVDHLVNDNEAELHAVVSIFGMGGLGKTTLARKVYNHLKIQGYFENFAWVCISQQWHQRDILQGILIKLLSWQREEIMKWRDEELIRQLFQVLRNKKCLVVLDDIWSIDAWESIIEAFPITKKGSKLLLTTRNSSVALHICPNGFHHEPRFLSDLESWELLQIKALRERTYISHEERQEMEELGKEMAKHCGGLPLAVVVLGGILSNKSDIREWKTVHKNVKAHIGRGKNILQQQGEIEKILELSYSDLPPKLKPCFLYLGTFSEDSDISVGKLYQIWIAEGMISIKDQVSGESMFDVAEHYLGDLAKRSMVQVKVNEDVIGVTRFKCCRLHDHMRDLSLKKAKEENFFSFVHCRNGFDDQVYKSSSSTNQIHRLVIHLEEDDVPKYIPPPKGITRHLRSLRLSVEGGYYLGPLPRAIKSQFNWFRMLRVLEIIGLYGVNADCKKFCFRVTDYLDLPEGIGNLIHLRYLFLGGSLFLRLPSSLVNLKQLQTLDLQDAYRLLLPNILWKMRQLKYVHLPREDTWGTLGCRKLRFDGMNKLEILTGFDSRFCSCKDLVKVTNLWLFEAKFDVKYDVIIEILKFISNSKSISHGFLDIKIPLDNSFTTDNKSAIITKLFSCRNLVSLVIRSPIGNLPKYEVGFAVGLVCLILAYSKIQDDPMETLEKLPNLKYLILDTNSFLGTEMQCRADGFPQLRVLKFWALPSFERWIIGEGAMPNLSSIQIQECRKLEMIPDGLRFITTLKDFKASGMPQEFNRRLQVINGQEGADFYKIRHVPMVKTGWIIMYIEFLLGTLMDALRNFAKGFKVSTL